MAAFNAFLTELPKTINNIFDVLEVLVIRILLLALAIIGAYSLIKDHL
jgi:hypothetical protein